MTHSVQQFIKTNNLPQTPSKLIVAVSGGADSVALLHLLINLGYECVVAHCNFHLRGKESDNDAKFVFELASKLQLPFFIKDFDTKAYAQTHKLSIEMSARELRYNWFEQLRIEQKAAAIAVAHHADDVVETFLMNITRGTGIHGLTGIKPRNGNIIRPLLHITRSEIEDYLKTLQQAFVNDYTNEEQIFTRNKIRHSLIPLFEAINPSFKNTIQATIKRLSEVETLYNKQIENLLPTLIQPYNEGFSIDSELLQKQPAINSFLHEILSPLGFSQANVQSLIKSLNGKSGKQFYSSTHRIIKDRQLIIVEPIQEKEDTIYYIEKNQRELTTPIHLSFNYSTTNKLVINKEKCVAYIDANKLEFPLLLRKWQKGDFFIPFGMKGKKKLSDFFIDKKYNLTKKENTWLLFSEKNLVWIVGEEIDNRYRITAISREILKIELR